MKQHNASEVTLGGRQWQAGDVIGLVCDLRGSALAASQQDAGEAQEQSEHQAESQGDAGGGSIWVSLNGDFSAPYGLVFRLPGGLEGLFAAFTSGTGAVRCNLGEQPFKYAPPDEGFKPMCSFHAP